MQFSEIRKAIHDAWTFAWPPLFACAIGFAIFRFLYPPITERLRILLAVAQQHSQSIEELRVVLEPYGLSKLIPYISFVFVVGFLYLMNNVVLIWCSKLPPHISYRLDELLTQRTPMEERLLLFRKYPFAYDLASAYYMALDGLPEANAPKNVNGTEPYYKVHTFVKFSLVVGLVAFVVAIRANQGLLMTLGRLMLLIVSLSVIWGTAFVGLLYEQQQAFGRGWLLLQTSLQTEAKSLLKAEPTDDEKRKLLHDERLVRRWWQVYLVAPSDRFTWYIAWFKTTFLRSKPY